MKQDGRIAASKAQGAVSLPRLALIGTPIVFVAYAIAIGVARELPLPITIAGAFANALATVIFGIAAYRLVQVGLVGRPARVQVAGHLLLSLAYALLTYWLLIVLLGAVNSASALQFNVVPFPNGASLWQLLENVTVYGVIAAIAYVRPEAETVTVVFEPECAEPPSSLSRYFIRSGDEIQPVDVDAIVSIAGADDYAEVRTLEGSHLVRLTLAQFEKSLDQARFIRVHRSRILNVERIASAEPAGGGRLLLHMEDGETIGASRSGSKLLKDRVL